MRNDPAGAHPIREELSKLQTPQAAPALSLVDVVRDELRQVIRDPEPEPQPARRVPTYSDVLRQPAVQSSAPVATTVTYPPTARSAPRVFQPTVAYRPPARSRRLAAAAAPRPHRGVASPPLDPFFSSDPVFPSPAATTLSSSASAETDTGQVQGRRQPEAKEKTRLHRDFRRTERRPVSDSGWRTTKAKWRRLREAVRRVRCRRAPLIAYVAVAAVCFAQTGYRPGRSTCHGRSLTIGFIKPGGLPPLDFTVWQKGVNSEKMSPFMPGQVTVWLSFVKTLEPLKLPAKATYTLDSSSGAVGSLSAFGELALSPAAYRGKGSLESGRPSRSTEAGTLDPTGTLEGSQIKGPNGTSRQLPRWCSPFDTAPESRNAVPGERQPRLAEPHLSAL
ncbi:hypothetical protein HPB50_007198 [Hyalomma asiaticum]|uniref:Uncharacterized protein n=1 Tax=Hyalomma asiaticum TaxID=266040 RepID=A0ACB7SWH1_HYAAI|nr:hypothetical protein HPB50_007198 [Hyalomma asiaticum]